MRNISFSMTTPQFRAKEKTVTRRFGWWNLNPGEVLWGCEKTMGLKKGESIVRIHQIRIITVRPQRLDSMASDRAYGIAELRKEGYPFGIKDPAEFVSMLARLSGKPLDALVNRIEFEYFTGVYKKGVG